MVRPESLLKIETNLLIHLTKNLVTKTNLKRENENLTVQVMIFQTLLIVTMTMNHNSKRAFHILSLKVFNYFSNK